MALASVQSAAPGLKPSSGGPAGDRPALASALMVLALALLSFQDSLVKLASADFSLWQFQALRAGGNLVLLIVFGSLAWRGAARLPRRPGAVLARTFSLVGAMILFFGAAPFLPLSHIAAGLYVFPLFVAVLSALFLGEKVGFRRVAAIAAGFSGALMILKPGADSFHWYTLMPVGAGFCYALNILITRKACRAESPATLAMAVAVAYVAVGIVGILAMSAVAPAALARNWPFLFTGWHTLTVAMIVLVAACSCLNLIANMALAKAYQSAESSWLAPFDYSYLVWATVWTVVMWADVPDTLTVAGMVLIAAAGIYVAWRERRDHQARAVAATALAPGTGR